MDENSPDLVTLFLRKRQFNVVTEIGRKSQKIRFITSTPGVRKCSDGLFTWLKV
jgi:hypothetical protein